jgi:hypothetical protein
VEEYCTAGQATDDNTAHAQCMLDAWGYKLIAFPLQRWLYVGAQCYITRTLPVRLISDPTPPGALYEGMYGNRIISYYHL